MCTPFSIGCGKSFIGTNKREGVLLVESYRFLTKHVYHGYGLCLQFIGYGDHCSVVARYFESKKYRLENECLVFDLVRVRLIKNNVIHPII